MNKLLFFRPDQERRIGENDDLDSVSVAETEVQSQFAPAASQAQTRPDRFDPASKRWRPDWTAMRANELRLWFEKARSIRRSIAPIRSFCRREDAWYHPFILSRAEEAIE